MKKRFFKFSALIMIVLITVIFSACGKKDSIGLEYAQNEFNPETDGRKKIDEQDYISDILLKDDRYNNYGFEITSKEFTRDVDVDCDQANIEIHARNDEAELYVTYFMYYYLSDEGWILNDFETRDSSILPLIECDISVADKAIGELYTEYEFVSREEDGIKTMFLYSSLFVIFPV